MIFEKKRIISEFSKNQRISFKRSLNNIHKDIPDSIKEENFIPIYHQKSLLNILQRKLSNIIS